MHNQFISKCLIQVISYAHCVMRWIPIMLRPHSVVKHVQAHYYEFPVHAWENCFMLSANDISLHIITEALICGRGWLRINILFAIRLQFSGNLFFPNPSEVYSNKNVRNQH